MKIRRVFGLFSVCSLAVLMTACGKSSKDKSIYDDKIFDLYATTTEEYKLENKSLDESVVVFKDQKFYYNNSSYSIVVTYDDDKYYFYNLKLEDKKIFEISKDDVKKIEIWNGLIRVSYDSTLTGYVYSFYMFNGECLLDKFNCATCSVYKGIGQTINTTLFTYLTSYKCTLTVTDPKGISTKVVYYTVYEGQPTSYQITDKDSYYNETDYKEEIGLEREFRMDGTLVGLKGYTIQSADNKTFIFKKDSLVNTIVMEDDLGILSHGHYLAQRITLVGKSDKYDFFFNGNYIKVNTYTVDLLTSKVTEVKNFKYYISPTTISVLIPDEKRGEEVINGYACSVLDFSDKKELTYSDLKSAYVQGNGKIKINEAMNPNMDVIIKENDTYYSYNMSNTNTTFITDKNGTVKDVKNGIYFDGITVTTSSSRYIFTDESGKTVLSLADYGYDDVEMLSFDKYVGFDTFGNKILAIINNGTVKTVDISDYTESDYDLLMKTSDEGIVTFYAYDENLTKVDLSYDKAASTFSYFLTVGECKYYRVYDKINGTYTLVYFK